MPVTVSYVMLIIRTSYACVGYLYIGIVIVIVIVIVITVESFHPSRNLDLVVTYNHIDLLSLPCRSHVNASMVLTRSDHLCIHNYIISLLNNILRPIVIVRMNSRPTACVSDALAAVCVCIK